MSSLCKVGAQWSSVKKIELIYTGWFKNNKPNGKGRMLFTDGTMYEGDWCDGLLEGEG